MTDADRLRTIYARLQWDGYGYWLPDMCVKVSGSFEEGDEPIPPTFDEFCKVLDSLASWRPVKGLS